MKLFAPILLNLLQKIFSDHFEPNTIVLLYENKTIDIVNAITASSHLPPILLNNVDHPQNAQNECIDRSAFIVTILRSNNLQLYLIEFYRTKITIKYTFNNLIIFDSTDNDDDDTDAMRNIFQLAVTRYANDHSDLLAYTIALWNVRTKSLYIWYPFDQQNPMRTLNATTVEFRELFPDKTANMNGQVFQMYSDMMPPYTLNVSVNVRSRSTSPPVRRQMIGGHFGYMATIVQRYFNATVWFQTRKYSLLAQITSQKRFIENVIEHMYSDVTDLIGTPICVEANNNRCDCISFALDHINFCIFP